MSRGMHDGERNVSLFYLISVIEKHIGFVSGVRNYKGVPWLLHHGYEGQTEYVEDHLEESRDLIVAHFRWR